MEHATHTIHHQFHVMTTGHELVVGRDLFTQLGLTLSWIPSGSIQSAPPMDTDSPHALEIPHPQKNQVDSAIADSLAANQLVKGFCRLPNGVLATFDLDLSSWKPKWIRSYRIPHAYQHIVRAQVEAWLEKGIIREARAGCQWNFPLTTAPKRNAGSTVKDTRRVCLDPSFINNLVGDIIFALPVISDLLKTYASSGMVMSIFDVASAFNTLMLTLRSQEVLTFEFEGRRYSFVGCPFGVRTLPAAWQQLISVILADFSDFCCAYMDDIVVYSKNVEDHIQHCQRLLERLTFCNLRVEPKKCRVAFTQIRILGHLVSYQKIALDKDKLKNVQEIPIPTTGKAIESFLGVTNFFRRFIPFYSHLAAPLEAARKCLRFQPTSAQVRAFTRLKAALWSAPIIHLPDYSLPFFLAVDASTSGLGGILFQIPGSNRQTQSPEQTDSTSWHIIDLVARSLSPAEKNYSVHALELTALAWALTRLHHIIYGFRTVVFSDHKSLTAITSQPKRTAHVERLWETILQYDIEVRYLPGVRNLLPDALSRLYQEEGENLLDQSSHQLLLIEQRSSDEQPELPPETTPSIDLDDHIPRESAVIADEVLSKRQPPPSERPALLQRAHSSHHGSKLMFRQLFHVYGVHWEGMERDCRVTARSCKDCILYTVPRRGFQPLQTVSAHYPFDSLSVDLAGPFPTTPAGHNYVLVVVDDCTGFVVLRPLTDKSAISTAWALYTIFSEFGAPKVLRSDRGTEFVNTLVRVLTQQLAVSHHLTAPYHPRANGKAEANVKLVKNMLIRSCHEMLQSWDRFLPAVQLSMNLRLPDRTGSTPFSLLFGRQFNVARDYQMTPDQLLSQKELLRRHVTMAEVVFPALRIRTDLYDQRVASSHDRIQLIQSPFEAGSLVMLRIPGLHAKTVPRWEGPYRVLRQGKSGSYLLQNARGEILNQKFPHEQLKLIDLPPDAAAGTSIWPSFQAITSPLSPVYSARGRHSVQATEQAAGGSQDITPVSASWEGNDVTTSDMSPELSPRADRPGSSDSPNDCGVHGGSPRPHSLHDGEPYPPPPAVAQSYQSFTQPQTISFRPFVSPFISPRTSVNSSSQTHRAILPKIGGLQQRPSLLSRSVFKPLRKH
jgi:transposase InsO family protein